MTAAQARSIALAAAHRRPPPSAVQPDVDLLTNLFDVQGLAHSRERAARIVKHAGSIGAAISFPEPKLRSIGASDVEIRLLHIVGSAVSLALRRTPNEKPRLSTLSTVVDYLHAQMAYQPVEEFRVLFLDTRLCLIHDEKMGSGSISSVNIHPRTVITRALEVNARHIMLVHNHPSGDPSPTEADVQLTIQIRDVGHVLDVKVIDHIIIAQSGHASLRNLGLI